MGLLISLLRFPRLRSSILFQEIAMMEKMTLLLSFNPFYKLHLYPELE